MPATCAPAATYVPLAHHGHEPRVAVLMVEFRRVGHAAEPGGPPHEGLDRLAQAWPNWWTPPVGLRHAF